MYVSRLYTSFTPQRMFAHMRKHQMEELVDRQWIDPSSCCTTDTVDLPAGSFACLSRKLLCGYGTFSLCYLTLWVGIVGYSCWLCWFLGSDFSLQLLRNCALGTCLAVWTDHQLRYSVGPLLLRHRGRRWGCTCLCWTNRICLWWLVCWGRLPRAAFLLSVVLICALFRSMWKALGTFSSLLILFQFFLHLSKWFLVWTGSQRIDSCLYPGLCNSSGVTGREETKNNTQISAWPPGATRGSVSCPRTLMDWGNLGNGTTLYPLSHSRTDCRSAAGS